MPCGFFVRLQLKVSQPQNTSFEVATQPDIHQTIVYIQHPCYLPGIDQLASEAYQVGSTDLCDCAVGAGVFEYEAVILPNCGGAATRMARDRHPDLHVLGHAKCLKDAAGITGQADFKVDNPTICEAVRADLSSDQPSGAFMCLQ